MADLKVWKSMGQKRLAVLMEVEALDAKLVKVNKSPLRYQPRADRLAAISGLAT